MKFGVWIDFLVEHEYFGGRCEDFCFIPASETRTLLRQENVLLRETVSGFRLTADDSAELEGKTLLFWAYPVRYDLWSVTTFDKVASDEIPVVHVQKNGLHWDSYPEKKLSGMERSTKPMFGVAVNDFAQILNSTIVLPLKTRKLKWRYCLSGFRSSDSIEVAAAKNAENGTSFDISTTQSNVTIFTSKDAIPLRYGAPPLFQLREKKTSKPIIKCLPNMDARSLAMVLLDDNKQELVAETFIYT